MFALHASQRIIKSGKKTNLKKSVSLKWSKITWRTCVKCSLNYLYLVYLFFYNKEVPTDEYEEKE